ncbi:MAG: exo-1,3-beta-glucanase [Pleopsidium flavum]|nr:MAG: exo-1,3-beta-glucanase [Pleopsidium flavum]
MLLNYALSALVAAGVAFANPIAKRSVAFNFGSDTVRGVNIGGWLVLEPWITPSIFQAQNGSVVDEWTLDAMVPNAGDILKKHWDTWVSLADFQKIAKAGFNTVRIPIGYWAYQKFDNDPYIQGAAPYVDLAIGWARQTGLKVWIDLHGAPESQNGYDNSGHLTKQPGWEQGDTVKQTLTVLQQIADKYAKADYQDVVVAIELLNEPLASELPSIDILKQFYRDGFGEVRSVSDTPVILHDAFQPSSSWNGFLTPSDNGAQNVIIDHHEYQVFSNEQVALSASQHRQAVCNNVGTYSSNTDHWVVVGEWTAAQTDCAAALNGYGIGARYDGTYPGSKYVGSCASVNFIETWSQQMKDDTRGFIEAQLQVYEGQTRGWVFWNFKTEASPEWDLFRLLDAGIFPQPLTDRKYGAICS